MTLKEINEILYLHKNKTSLWESTNYRLYLVRQKMQTIKTASYDSERVQGGEKRSFLEELIDREKSLETALQRLSIEIDNAYAGAMRLIYLLDNKDKDCDVLSFIYLQNKNYYETSKHFVYDCAYLRVKVNRAKRRLLSITNEKSLSKENFLK